MEILTNDSMLKLLKELLISNEFFENPLTLSSINLKGFMHPLISLND